jgi:hypothetical protein
VNACFETPSFSCIALQLVKELIKRFISKSTPSLARKPKPQQLAEGPQFYWQKQPIKSGEPLTNLPIAHPFISLLSFTANAPLPTPFCDSASFSEVGFIRSSKKDPQQNQERI